MLTGCNTYQPPPPNPKTEVIDAFPKSEVPKMKKELSGKKLALALITTYDYNHSTDGIESMFQDEFSEFSDEYVLYMDRTQNLNDFFNDLRDYSTLQPIDALILVYHGNPLSMDVKYNQEISVLNAERLFKNYKSVFSKDAIILFYSCSTGEGSQNIAIEISDILDVDVIAPKASLFTENQINENERVGEFSLDQNDRITYHPENFVLYTVYLEEDKFAKKEIGTRAFLKNKKRYPEDFDKCFLVIDK